MTTELESSISAELHRLVDALKEQPDALVLVNVALSTWLANGDLRTALVLAGVPVLGNVFRSVRAIRDIEPIRRQLQNLASRLDSNAADHLSQLNSLHKALMQEMNSADSSLRDTIEKNLNDRTSKAAFRKLLLDVTAEERASPWQSKSRGFARLLAGMAAASQNAQQHLALLARAYGRIEPIHVNILATLREADQVIQRVIKQVDSTPGSSSVDLPFACNSVSVTSVRYQVPMPLRFNGQESLGCVSTSDIARCVGTTDGYVLAALSEMVTLGLADEGFRGTLNSAARPRHWHKGPLADEFAAYVIASEAKLEAGIPE